MRDKVLPKQRWFAIPRAGARPACGVRVVRGEWWGETPPYGDYWREAPGRARGGVGVGLAWRFGSQVWARDWPGYLAHHFGPRGWGQSLSPTTPSRL